MKLTRVALSALVVFAVCVFFTSLANAQATRTWVSGVGDDANPCSRTAPCKTFAGAISKTAAAGEINCLDPGGFGAVTITKSITIDCLHTLGGVLVAGGNGINVSAAAGDRVVLRGLDINGVGGLGVNGISFSSGGSLHVEDSVIYGLQNGISIGASSEVYIKNTYIRNNTNIGVYITGGGGLVNAVIERTTVENQAYGLVAGANTRITTRGSVYSGNSSVGILAQGAGTAAEVNVDECIVSSNGVGLYSGALGTISVAGSFISGNGTAVAAAASGVAATFLNNKFHGNTSDGGFTAGLTMY
jgi:hypothetical protein